MKRFRQHIALLVLVLIWGACQETIPLDIDNSEPQIVIDGLITNSSLNYVKVTRSRGFYDSGPAESVLSASVTVTDGQGVVYVFAHDSNEEGVYKAPPGFMGVLGETYTLSAIVDGTEYNASETLLPVTTIDSLTVEIDFDELELVGEEGRFYEVIFFAQEPQDRVDHYLFRFYRNGELIKDAPEDIYFSEDEFLGESIDDLPIAGYYEEGDLVRVEMYSITREAFVFYADLFNLINGDGGMFSPPPSNPRTNLSNNALGYFQVSAIDVEEITVTDPRED